jgi:hypothetical protein
MMVVSRGRLLSKSSFPLMAGTRAWDLGGFLARLKGHGGAPGVEFMDRPDGLVRASSWRRLVVILEVVVTASAQAHPAPALYGAGLAMTGWLVELEVPA